MVGPKVNDRCLGFHTSKLSEWRMRHTKRHQEAACEVSFYACTIVIIGERRGWRGGGGVVKERKKER